jgi:hypothetical protein
VQPFSASRRLVRYSGSVGLLALALSACAPPPTTGTLELEISTPADFLPSVTVSGPDFKRSFDAAGPARLSNLQPGSYSITAHAITPDGGYTYRARIRVDAEVVSASSSAQTHGSSQIAAGQTRRVSVEYQVATGRLSLGLSVLPSLAGFTPLVQVTRSDGFSQSLSADVVLNLEPGAYTLTPIAPPPGYTLWQSGQSVEVVAGQEVSAAVSYAQGFGGLSVNIAPPQGVPDFTAGVVVRGPDGSLLETLNASQTYARLPAGRYTLTAAPVTAAGVTWQPSTTRLSLEVPVGGVGSGSLSYTASNSAITVNLSGLGVADAATVNLQPGNQTRTRTGNGPVRFEGLAFGSYTVTARAVRPGAWVDSYLVGGQAPVQSSSASPMPDTSLSGWTARGGTGRIWVAGNGGFSNGGRGSTSTGELSAAYSLADGASSFTSFISPTASHGPFRIAFDREGNLYVLYQYVSASSPARIVRISEANLRNNQLSEAAPGNTHIDGGVWGWPSGATPSPQMEVSGNEPADLAFDAYGNLWVVNDYLGLLACVRASELRAAPGRIDSAGTRIWGPGTGLYSYVLNTPGQNADHRPFLIPHALTFDPSGNLWFTSGGYQGPRPGETSPVKRSFLNRLHASRISYAASGDCNGGDVALTESSLSQWVDIRLDISLPGSDYGAVIKPVTMALEPGGGALWIGDFGGNAGGSGDFYRDANSIPETLLRVPLAGSNLTPGASWQTATVSHRLTLGAGPGLDRGLQQAFGLAFDRAGYLWVAANNNVEVLPTDTGMAALALTDRRGKLYRLDVRGYVGNNETYDGRNTFNLRGAAPEPISVATDGVGLIGVAFNLPNPSSLPNTRP